MKVRVCPKCGKHNPENSWECADCGETLPTSTLVELEKGKPSATDVRKQALSGISRFFEEDVAEVLDKNAIFTEDVRWGCNITQIASKPPFNFGYLIITSIRLIRVQFNSEVKRKDPELLVWFFKVLALLAGVLFWRRRAPDLQPKRSWTGDGFSFAVNNPGYSLTPEEINSREVETRDLGDLTAARFNSYWLKDVRFTTLTLSFHKAEALSLTFQAPHLAEEAEKQLAPWMSK